MTATSVLITGAAGALGQSVVRATLAAGHTVLAIDRAHLESPAFQEAIEGAGERVLALQGDALSPEFMEGAVQQAQERFGELGGLFHLAGGYRYAPLDRTDLDLWRHMLDVNVTSAYVAARACLPAVRRSRGSMVFVGAQAAISAPANQPAYNASKAALMTFARTLSQELRPDGVRVNCIVPDIMDTPANRKSMPGADTSKWLTLEQVADVLLYLLSADASAVTGATLALQRT